MSSAPIHKRLRAPFVFLVVLGLVALAAWPRASLVDTAAVSLGEVRETVEAEGRTRLRERFEIHAPVDARARRIELEPGDFVAAGQVLVVLEPLLAPALDARERRVTEARLEAAKALSQAAEAEVRAARASRDLAAWELERGRILGEANVVSAERIELLTTELARAEGLFESANARVWAAEREVDALRAALALDTEAPASDSTMELRSPLEGRLVSRLFESERVVRAGELLLVVGAVEALEVEVDVLSSDAVRLREGMPVDLLRWGEPRPLAARVRRIEPGGFTKVSALGVEEQRVWVVLELLDSEERLARIGDGYRVHARFELRASRGTLWVPASAVFRHEDGHAVFALRDGRAHRVPIERGLAGEGRVEVLSGLEAGGLVIVHPDRELEAGARVRARERRP